VKAKNLEQQDWLQHERILWRSGIKYIAGVDEVGRGCLVGPVVAAAVILPLNIDIIGVYDSKVMSVPMREEAYHRILEQSAFFALGAASNRIIDNIGILKATLLAMQRAIRRLRCRPDHILIDGNRCPDDLPCAAESIIGGDGKSRSIAAASVIAKVIRDRLLIRLSRIYQHYGFESHKGYGTVRHLTAINTYGSTPHHRLSFKPLSQLSPILKTST